jgi:hypothetical protein
VNLCTAVPNHFLQQSSPKKHVVVAYAGTKKPNGVGYYTSARADGFQASMSIENQIQSERVRCLFQLCVQTNPSELYFCILKIIAAKQSDQDAAIPLQAVYLPYGCVHENERRKQRTQ